MNPLPLPPHYHPGAVGQVWRVPYQERAAQAVQWAEKYAIAPAASDRLRLLLIAVDVQNTFCIPEFELFVGGRSGKGAVEDNQRRIVLDIDCIAETDDPTGLPLEETLVSLHDDRLWDIFDRFLTPRYRALLEGGPL